MTRAPRVPGDEAASGEAASGAAIARELLAELARRRTQEGFSAAADDAFATGELAHAAAAYAFTGALTAPEDRHAAVSPKGPPISERSWLHNVISELWPFSWSWWRPSSPRADLVKAGALIIAEIERLDRSAQPKAAPAAPRLTDGTLRAILGRCFDADFARMNEAGRARVVEVAVKAILEQLATGANGELNGGQS